MSSTTPPPDLVIRIALLQRINRHDYDHSPWKELSPSIWRIFRCSSAINLDVFQDKILQPIMGWTRNYHAYWFEQEITIGSKTKKLYYYCPRSKDLAEYPDAMSFGDRAKDGKHVNPRDYTIGDILNDTPSSCRYVYDFGDFWMHQMICETVIHYDATDEDFGKVKVLEGAMRCPDEDGQGGNNYQERVLDLLLRVRQNASNKEAKAAYAKACFKRVDAINVNGIFDAEDFDINERQKAVADALHTTLCCRDGPKTIVGVGGFSGMGNVIDAVPLDPGQRKYITEKQDTRFGGGSSMIGLVQICEIVNCKPDMEKFSVCYYCGNPWKTKMCGRCEIACYCSSDCQVTDWKDHHKKVCKKKMAREFEAYMAEKAGTKPVSSQSFMQPRIMLKMFDPNKMRFKVGDKVECSMSENTFIKGTVMQVLPRGDSGDIVAYQVKLNYPDCQRVGAPRGACIWAVWDHDHVIRAT